MKTAVFALLFALVAFAYGDEKVYLPIEKLAFTDKGIFLKRGQCTIQLPFIHLTAGKPRPSGRGGTAAPQKIV